VFKVDQLKDLPPSVNFINILQAALTHTDPERAKKTDNLTVFFVLLGSSCTKAARRMFKFYPSLRILGISANEMV